MRYLEKKVLRCVPKAHHETSDDYIKIIVRLNDSWRVIVCKDNIQWVLQRRDAGRSGSPRWRGVSYHCELKALIRVSRTRAKKLEVTALAQLEALPVVFNNPNWRP
jgi:hypothetical protein